MVFDTLRCEPPFFIRTFMNTSATGVSQPTRSKDSGQNLDCRPSHVIDSIDI